MRQELEPLSPVFTCWFQTYRNLEDAAVLVRSAQRETLVTHGLPRLVPPGASMLLPTAPSLFPTHQRQAVKMPITESPATLSNAMSWQVGSLWALTQCKAIAGVFATNHLIHSSQQACCGWGNSLRCSLCYLSKATQLVSEGVNILLKICWL